MHHSLAISTTKIPPGPSPLLLAFMISVLAAFGIAAVIGLFTLRDWGWRRFVPLAFVVFALLPTVVSHLGLSDSLLEATYFSYLPAFAFLIFTLIISWRARRLPEHVLRNSGAILLLYSIYNLIRAI